MTISLWKTAVVIKPVEESAKQPGQGGNGLEGFRQHQRQAEVPLNTVYPF